MSQMKHKQIADLNIKCKLLILQLQLDSTYVIWETFTNTQMFRPMQLKSNIVNTFIQILKFLQIKTMASNNTDKFT